jgi:hypothetical protein
MSSGRFPMLNEAFCADTNKGAGEPDLICAVQAGVRINKIQNMERDIRSYIGCDMSCFIIPASQSDGRRS